MATGDSSVDICNLGLLALGQDKINALTDNRKAAILCNQRYDQIRREILRAHPWGFARKRQQLPEAAVQPPFGNATAFTLPSDFIRLAISPEQAKDCGWAIEGRTLLCPQSAPLNLVYIYDCADTTVFDPLFVAVLGYGIAAELAIPLTQDRGLKAQMEGEMEGKLSMARLVTAQDNSSDVIDCDILLRSRD